jgi:diguanylate cyclase (GGDEF)-like protein
VDRAQRYGDHFSLILIDIDQFKTINDTFGHDTGDEVLGWIGRVLTEHTRAADMPFRVGGEEFAVLAPATGAEVAQSVAERLVSLVAEARPPVKVELRLTMSAGFASCPDHGASATHLYSTADQALLQAKNFGRNRVCAPGEDGSQEASPPSGNAPPA